MEDRVPMFTPWRTPFDPTPPPPYSIGFELTSGRIVRVRPADSLLWGQVLLIQFVARLREASGAGVVVLIHTPSGQIRDRVVVPAPGANPSATR
jgi:hypothetical protein